LSYLKFLKIVYDNSYIKNIYVYIFL
jgi:hypothetical protein